MVDHPPFLMSGVDNPPFFMKVVDPSPFFMKEVDPPPFLKKVVDQPFYALPPRCVFGSLPNLLGCSILQNFYHHEHWPAKLVFCCNHNKENNSQYFEKGDGHRNTHTQRLWNVESPSTNREQNEGFFYNTHLNTKGWRLSCNFQIRNNGLIAFL